MTFKNRLEAGKLLAEKFETGGKKENQLVLAVSDSGIVIGEQISSVLACPLKFYTPDKLPPVKDKNVIVVDDGVVTGGTMKKAVGQIRQQDPKKIIVAIPVIAKESLGKIQELADMVIFLEAPEPFFSLSQYYEEF